MQNQVLGPSRGRVCVSAASCTLWSGVGVLTQTAAALKDWSEEWKWASASFIYKLGRSQYCRVCWAWNRRESPAFTACRWSESKPKSFSRVRRILKGIWELGSFQKGNLCFLQLYTQNSVIFTISALPDSFPLQMFFFFFWLSTLGCVTLLLNLLLHCCF